MVQLAPQGQLPWILILFIYLFIYLFLILCFLFIVEFVIVNFDLRPPALRLRELQTQERLRHNFEHSL